MTSARPPTSAEPPADCPICPRLAAFRQANRSRFPDYHNAPVPSFGQQSARVLIVGLAPGLHGANRTGRPFTGDHAGALLYATLDKFGFSHGQFDARPDDGLRLVDCRITNAVRCLPPENKPVGQEIRSCGPYLRGEIAGMQRLRVIVALGGVAHGAVLAACGLRKSAYPFGHGAVHALPTGVTLADSYHCSRYNTNTGRLTAGMFEAVFARIHDRLDKASE